MLAGSDTGEGLGLTGLKLFDQYLMLLPTHPTLAGPNSTQPSDPKISSCRESER